MTSNSELSLPSHHIFVDFENVPEVESSVFALQGVALTLVVGANQTKLDAALVEKVMGHSPRPHLVRLTTGGKNAVDFALSYHLGCAVVANPKACFHIVSKDKGFDPLIEYLCGRQVRVRRHGDFEALTYPDPVPSSPTPSKEVVTRALEHLRKNLNHRPKRKKTLASHLRGIAGKTAGESDILCLIEQLRTAGHISLDAKDAVTYHL